VVQSTEAPAMLGDPITFSAIVHPVQTTNGTPTGTVQLQIDGTDVGAPVTLVNAAASFPPVTLGGGQHAVAVVYTSDRDLFHSGRGSVAGGEVVNPAGVSVGVAVSPPESRYGQPLSFMATVQASTAGLPGLGGSIQFQVDGVSVGDPINVVDGKAISPS